MSERSKAAAAQITAHRTQLAEQITRLHYARDPELERRYGPSGRQKCMEDAHYHLSYLSSALDAGEAKLFVDYAEWAREMLQARGIPTEDLRDNLEVIRSALHSLVSAAAQVADEYLDLAIEALRHPRISKSFLQSSEPLADLSAGYLQALLRMDRRAARQLIFEALEDPDVTVGDIYLHVFERTQREIGRLWQTNQVSVGQEHYCTAVTQTIMSELYPRIFNRQRNGKTALIVCASGDLHELGARMVSDHLELDGWETIFLGANTPVASIVDMVRLHKPDILAISVAMTFHLDRIRDIVNRLRSDSSLQTRIIVGGYPFRVAPNLWREIGADGFADDAAGAVKLAGELASAA